MVKTQALFKTIYDNFKSFIMILRPSQFTPNSYQARRAMRAAQKVMRRVVAKEVIDIA